MSVRLQIRGAEDFKKLSKALREAGMEGKRLRKELRKEINRETKPLKQDAKKNARAILPKRGGLARRVARSGFRTSTKLTGPGVGVRIVGKGKRPALDIRSIDKGRVRHPVFGNKDRWVTQSVTPGWFTKAMDKGKGKVREGVLRAVNAIVRKLNNF